MESNPINQFLLSWALEANKSRKGRDRGTLGLTFVPLPWKRFISFSLFSLLLLSLKIPLASTAKKHSFLIPMVRYDTRRLLTLPPCRLQQLLRMQGRIPDGSHDLPRWSVLEQFTRWLPTIGQRQLQERDQVCQGVDALRRLLLPSLQGQGIHSCPAGPSSHAAFL